VSERALTLSPARREELAGEIGRLRRDASARYSELDLLVAAMREHIEDLRRERDRLLARLDGIEDQLRRKDARWLERGQKGPRR
jgi:hypothetical protein